MSPMPLYFAGLLLHGAQLTAAGLTTKNCDFGEAYSFNRVECQIDVGNESGKAIRIFDIVPTSPGDAAGVHELSVPAKSHAYLPVQIQLDNDVGFIRRRFRFHTDRADQQDGILIASGFVLSALDQASPEIDFDVVDLDKSLPEKSIELGSHDAPDFHVLKIIGKPNWTDVEVLPDQRTVRVHIRPDAAWGLHSELVKLAIDSPQQKQAWILVTADIHGDIVPATNPYDLGLVRSGSNNEFRIPLASRSGKSLKIGKVVLDKIVGRAAVTGCQPESAACRLIVVTLDKGQPLGSIKGNVWVELPEHKQNLQIALRALLVNADLKVKTLDPEQLNAQASQTISYTTEMDLKATLTNAVRETSDTPPAGTGPLLKWAIANGRTIYGFQIFRADKEQGPFVLANASAIRSKAETEDTESYQYRDNTAESGKTYWYYIGIVYNDGHKQKLTDPQKVVAK